MWRDNLRPASFRGVGFYVEVGSRTGGRRAVTHEFPHRDDPQTEDMGRRAKKFGLTAYVLGSSYTLDADALEEALNAAGAGLLVHPTMGEMRVLCEMMNRNERRELGGYAAFDCTFTEAGSSTAVRRTEATQSNLKAQASSTSATIASKGDAAASEAIDV